MGSYCSLLFGLYLEHAFELPISSANVKRRNAESQRDSSKNCWFDINREYTSTDQLIPHTHLMRKKSFKSILIVDYHQQIYGTVCEACFFPGCRRIAITSESQKFVDRMIFGQVTRNKMWFDLNLLHKKYTKSFYEMAVYYVTVCIYLFTFFESPILFYGIWQEKCLKL